MFHIEIYGFFYTEKYGCHMQSWARDNMAMFSGHKVVIYWNINVFDWPLHLDTEI